MTNTSALFDWNNSLVGYWSFDYYNSSGIYDNSTYNNFGTFENGLSTSDITTGKYGHGLEFDGVDDHLNVSNSESLNITNAITLEAWVYPKSVKDQGIIAKANYSAAILQQIYVLKIMDDNKFWFTLSGTSIGCEAYSPNNWYHVVATWNGNWMKLYINGQYLSGVSKSGDIPTTTAPLTIGSIYNSYLFNGTIDEVRIYNRALSSEEINASYNNGLHRLYHNFTGLSDGLYNYTAWAIDQAGNMNKSSQREVTIDTTLPTIVIDTPKNTSYDVNYLDVNVTADEDADWCGFNLDNSGSNISMSGSEKEWYYQLTGLSTKTYHLFTYCNDSAGNMNLNNSIWFTILWECINGRVLHWNNATPVSNADVDLKIYDDNLNLLGEETGTTDSQGNYHICLGVDMRTRKRYLVNITVTKESYHSYLKYYVRHGD